MRRKVRISRGAPASPHPLARRSIESVSPSSPPPYPQLCALFVLSLGATNTGRTDLAQVTNPRTQRPLRSRKNGAFASRLYARLARHTSAFRLGAIQHRRRPHPHPTRRCARNSPCKARFSTPAPRAFLMHRSDIPASTPSQDGVARCAPRLSLCVVHPNSSALCF